MSACPFCGEPFRLEVADVHLEARAFALDGCCSAAVEDSLAWLAEPAGSPDAPDRRDVCAFFRRELGVTLRAVHLDAALGLRFGGGGLVLDFGLESCAVTLAQAKAYVRAHHRHADRPPAGWRWGHGLRNGPDLVALAMVGRPSARALDAATTVEVTRLVVDEGVGRLAWCACSSLYAAAAREAQRRGFERVVTYTLEGELGTSLRAAGWEPDRHVPAARRGWDRPSRPRPGSRPSPAKVRWQRRLR